MSAFLVTTAALLSELNLVGVLTVTAGAIGTLGGIAWVISAIDGAEAAVMIRQDHLMLLLAVVLLVTNFLGAAFTIRRNYLQKRRKLSPGQSSVPLLTRWLF
jgi:hypothetical protein